MKITADVNPKAPWFSLEIQIEGHFRTLSLQMSGGQYSEFLEAIGVPENPESYGDRPENHPKALRFFEELADRINKGA